jgi:hypothetical protein
MSLRDMSDGVAQDKVMCRPLVVTVMNLQDCVFNCVYNISRVNTLLIQSTTNIQFPQKA